jgi:hypothetical protein
MAGKAGNSKKPRGYPHAGRHEGCTIKTGKRGARKTNLDHQQKILIGNNKGAVKTLKPVSCSPWMGASGVGEPFDREQAEKNWAAGLCG